MPKSKHPLRTLRAATPHPTQAAFAEFLGVPVAALQAVESGRARPTPRFAARVREMTGADEVELLRGAAGRAVMLSGGRFTAASFAAWRGSEAQRAETERRLAREHAQQAAWSKLAQQAECAASPEDCLVPYQTCEFFSAPLREWKRLPEAVRQRTGWPAELPVSAPAQLTLAVQAAPVWDPDTAPPGMAAANADLFPPCYFTVAAGSAGCRMAAAYWQALCREHGVSPEDGHPLHGTPTGNWRGFFREQPGRCEPHAVFAGLDAEEAQTLAGGLYSPGGILSGGSADLLADEALRFMKEHSEDAGSPAGILLFASLEGGTASALGSAILTQLRREFPAMPILVIGVLPLPGVSPVIPAPWHLALAMQAIRQQASAALLFSNDHLLHHTARDWQLPARGYDAANLLIAEALSTLTAPLRFGGADTPPANLSALVACFRDPAGGSLPVITARCWPLAALTDRRLKTVTLPWLMQRTLRRAAAEHLTNGPGVAAFLRVRLAPGSLWISGDAPPSVQLCGYRGTGRHESASVFAPSPVIRRTLQRLARQATELLKLENAPALCKQLGVEEAALRSAVQALAE